MKKWNIVAAALLTLFSASVCLADTLVITYRSGKTQTVTLDEPSTTINSWQFVGGTTAATPQQQPSLQQDVQKSAVTPEPAKDAKKVTDKTPDKKSGVRFMWNAPPIKD